MLKVCLSEEVLQKKSYYIDVFENIVKTRVFDDKSFLLSKQNQGGTFHLSSAGHEMVGVIGALLLSKGKDWGLPYYRDRGFAIGVGSDLTELMAAFLGRSVKNHSGGRQMPEHYSDQKLRIPCQSSCVGSQFLQAVGVAKSSQLRKTDEVVYVSAGDGATSQGDFHETLNFASLHKLPLIVVIQDNDWAISVPKGEQTAGFCISKMARGYEGLEVFVVNGADCVSLTKAFIQAIERGRSGEGPSLIVAKVPRIGPHSSSDNPKKYKTSADELADLARDPIEVMKEWLVKEGVLSFQEIVAIEQKVIDEINRVIAKALEIPHPEPIVSIDNILLKTSSSSFEPEVDGEPVVMVDALNLALKEEMRLDRGVVIFGQDVAHGKGGVFGVTRDLTDLFSNNRCFNTPLAESTILGLALGLSLDGFHKPVAEIQFADYLWTGFNQLINEIASYYYRSNGIWNLPLVVRMPCGAYIQGGPYHSQNIEGILAHIPGIKIVIPSNAYDAKGLLKSAIRDPNPVIFLEHKAIYRQKRFVARALPSEDTLVPIGKGAVVKKGSDITLIAWGYQVMISFDVALELEKEGVSVEVIDLRSIYPLDEELIIASLKKTGRLMIVHEAAKTGGFGGEIAALMVEKAFAHLDAPIMRHTGALSVVPYSKILEEVYLPSKESLKRELISLARY
jgi:2-oxoisovalerate dehydrogenase E1 component